MKKIFILIIFVIVAAILSIIFFSRKEEEMDKILNSKLAKGQSLELIINYDNTNQITYYGITIYYGEKKEKSYGFSRKKKLESYTLFEYDKNDNLIKSLDHNADGTFFRTFYYEYDDQNRLSEYYGRIENMMGNNYTTICEYDNYGNLIKTKEYQEPVEEDNLNRYSEYEYEDTRLVNVKNYAYISEDKQGILKSYDKHIYDEEGKLSKKYIYNAEDELTNTLTYEYSY